MIFKNQYNVVYLYILYLLYYWLKINNINNWFRYHWLDYLWPNKKLVYEYQSLQKKDLLLHWGNKYKTLFIIGTYLFNFSFYILLKWTWSIRSVRWSSWWRSIIIQHVWLVNLTVWRCGGWSSIFKMWRRIMEIPGIVWIRMIMWYRL